MLEQAVARSTLIVLLLSTTVLHCGGCERSSNLTDEGQRVWGRHKLAEDVKARAETPIDVYKLDVDADSRARVLSMTFDEVVARYGFVSLKASARFELIRNGHAIRVHERTAVEHGLHGSFRIVQKDEDEEVTREIVFNNDVLYIRNGPSGKMRVQGIIQDRHLALREEAWAPLKTFTAYFGNRLNLVQAGSSRVGRKKAARYRFSLERGNEPVAVPGMKGQREPIALSGDLFVDEKTGVATKVKLRGELKVPGAPDSKPGVLKVFLEMTMSPGTGKEIRPEEFVPTIAHRPVDLDPLKFLDSDTRTSTVIGGRR